MQVKRAINYEAGIAAAAEGKSNNKIAVIMGLSLYELHKIMKNDPLFRDQLESARAFGLSLHADKLLHLEEHYPDADPPMLRVISDNIKWVASHLAPQFRTTTHIEVRHANVKDALQEARSRVIDVTPKPKQIVNPLD